MVITKKSRVKENLARGNENIAVYSDMLRHNPHLFFSLIYVNWTKKKEIHKENIYVKKKKPSQNIK